MPGQAHQEMRLPMYDLRFEEFPREVRECGEREGGAWRRLCTYTRCRKERYEEEQDEEEQQKSKWSPKAEILVRNAKRKGAGIFRVIIFVASLFFRVA